MTQDQNRDAARELLEVTMLMDEQYRSLAMFRHKVSIRDLSDAEVSELYQVIKEVNAIMRNANDVHVKIAETVNQRRGHS